MKRKLATEKNTLVFDRKGLRYKADPNTLVRIDSVGQSLSQFNPNTIGIAIEESFRGCGILLAMTKDLNPGDHMMVQVGDGPIMAAEVRWRTELDAHAIRIGIMYIET